MKGKRTRRAGATSTVGVSLDAKTKRNLKTLANEKHGGNVSALISQMTEEAIRAAAFERAWEWYGGPELDEATRGRLDRELDEGWELARRQRKKSGRTAA